MFKKETIERFKGHFLGVLHQIAVNPGIQLSEIEMMTSKEKDQIMYDFNNTRTGYPKDKPVHELFEKLAEKTPENIAVFQEWTKKLNTFLSSQELSDEAEFWRKQAETEIIPLPKDKLIAQRKNADCIYISACLLEEAETKKLLDVAKSFYKTNTRDLILTALGETIREWSGERKILINLLIHGRDDFDADIDVSRTIGWLNMGYPIILDVKETGDIGRQVLSIKELMSQVPKSGLRYRQAIEYLTREENKKGINYWIQPEIMFNYSGENAQIGLSNTLNNTGVDLEISPSPISTGVSFGSTDINDHAFALYLEISRGRLNLSVCYNIIEYQETTVAELLEGFTKNLRRIAEYPDKSGAGM